MSYGILIKENLASSHFLKVYLYVKSTVGFAPLCPAGFVDSRRAGQILGRCKHPWWLWIDIWVFYWGMFVLAAGYLWHNFELSQISHKCGECFCGALLTFQINEPRQSAHSNSTQNSGPRGGMPHLWDSEQNYISVEHTINTPPWIYQFQTGFYSELHADNRWFNRERNNAVVDICLTYVAP